MRTVEQIADELVEKFYSVEGFLGFKKMTRYESIQCAIIAVDEIIESNPTEINEKHYIKPYTSDYMESSIPFWQQIKHELEKRLK